MRKERKTASETGRGELLASCFEGFDYRVEPDDFLLYQLGNLVEEDRASFEEEEFRNTIDSGIRQHVEERPEIRAELAWRLRKSCGGMEQELKDIAFRAIAALEDIEVPLRNVAAIVRTYTAYLFVKLQKASEEATDLEDHARGWIERWQKGEVRHEEMVRQLKLIGRPAVGPAADLLFDAVEETPPGREAAQIAVEILGGIRSSASSRVLAHAVSEPMLDEDLESKTYRLLLGFWPLPRHYVLSALRPHTHEDLPYRWFQLFVEANEIYAVDLILEEFAVHAANSAFHPDLAALADLLQRCNDPEAEDKMLQFLNTVDAPRPVIGLIEDVLRTRRPAPQLPADSNPWLRLSNLRSANRKYIAAAKLFDSGKETEALRKIDEILKDEPGYPFAVMLKGISRPEFCG